LNAYLQTRLETKFQEESKMKRNIFQIALLAVSLLTLLGAASAQGRIDKWERRELRADRHEVRADMKDIRSDRRDINKDAVERRGDVPRVASGQTGRSIASGAAGRSSRK